MPQKTRALPWSESCRVARGSFTPRPSRNRTGASRLIRLLSPGQGRVSPPGCSPSLGWPDDETETLTVFPRRAPPHRWVGPTTKPGDWAPSLHAHYRHFDATTSPSAPVPRIGTLALVGLPLELLPWHRSDRFPGSPFEPGSDSRHLNAGRRAGSKRISPALIPGQRLLPGFDVVHTLSTLHRWFTRVRLSDPHLTRSRRAFSLTLTTRALNPSRSRWFGACLRRPAPRDLPSSRTDIAWRTVIRISNQMDLASRTPSACVAEASL
jgi:hypothetical protein